MDLFTLGVIIAGIVFGAALTFVILGPSVGGRHRRALGVIELLDRRI